MSYSSGTKSWSVCSKDQRRECMAHATFNRLYSLPDEASSFVSSIKRNLLQKIRPLKDTEFSNLTDSKKTLVLLEKIIENLSTDVAGIETIESIFNQIEEFIGQLYIASLGNKLTKSLLKDRELSKLIRAIKIFRWSGTSLSPQPSGKSESSIGISDSLLDTLLSKSGGDSLLTSWLQKADTSWKKVVDSEIEKREKEIARLKRGNNANPQTNVLETEIASLKQNWKL